MTIPQSDLEKLSKMTWLDPNDPEYQTLLGQVDKIIAMIDTIQEYECCEQVAHTEHCVHLQSWLHDSMSREDFFHNVDHPKEDNMIVLETSTNEQ